MLRAGLTRAHPRYTPTHVSLQVSVREHFNDVMHARSTRCRQDSIDNRVSAMTHNGVAHRCYEGRPCI